MSDTPIEVLTAFLVVVEPNGAVSVLTDQIPAMDLQRLATLDDIATYASHAARSANNALIGAMLAPPSRPTMGQKVSAALAKRSGENDVH